MRFLDDLASVSDPSIELGVAQTARDFAMLEKLIEERKKRYPDISEFSDSLGISEEKIEEFELAPDDFSVGFVRLYAIGVRAAIHHYVEPSPKPKEKTEG